MNNICMYFMYHCRQEFGYTYNLFKTMRSLAWGTSETLYMQLWVWVHLGESMCSVTLAQRVWQNSNYILAIWMNINLDYGILTMLNIVLWKKKLFPLSLLLLYI